MFVALPKRLFVANMVHGNSNTYCRDFAFGALGTNGYQGRTATLAVEHILEWQLLSIFFNEISFSKGAYIDNPVQDEKDLVTICKAMFPYWYKVPQRYRITVAGYGDGTPLSPLEFPKFGYPEKYSHADEFVLLDWDVNAIKKGVGHLTATLFPLLTVQSADVEF
jgi:hypothetical protein